MNTGEPATMPVRLRRWNQRPSGALRGFADIVVGQAFALFDVAVFSRGGKAWAALPGKPLVANGRLLLDAKGKVRYGLFAEWTDRAFQDRFSNAVVQAVLAEYPHALDDATPLLETRP